MDEGEEEGIELGGEDVVRTNSTVEVDGMGENERGGDGGLDEVVRSMLLDCIGGCCGKGGDALD